MSGDFEDKVRKRMAELTERPYSELEAATTQKRIAWCVEHAADGSAALTGTEAAPPRGRRWSPREAFELLFFSYMGLAPEGLPVVEETAEAITWESRNPCATLEACRRLGLDTRTVCRAVYERPAQAFLSCLDPELRFQRDYREIRPYADHCRECIRRVHGR
jgi:hypothetical protein